MTAREADSLRKRPNDVKKRRGEPPLAPRTESYDAQILEFFAALATRFHVDSLLSQPRCLAAKSHTIADRRELFLSDNQVDVDAQFPRHTHRKK